MLAQLFGEKFGEVGSSGGSPGPGHGHYPPSNPPLADLYKVRLNADGFFAGAHPKIKPVESSTAGIYMAGLCHYPKPIQESITEALAREVSGKKFVWDGTTIYR
jgi:heterodisulfide reductase subunit A-like polyferredoxin